MPEMIYILLSLLERLLLLLFLFFLALCIHALVLAVHILIAMPAEERERKLRW